MDDGTYNVTYSATYSNTDASVSSHVGRVKADIKKFEHLFGWGSGTVPAGRNSRRRPDDIQAFPAHRRLPGENFPYRLEDGGNSTQPRRGSRRMSTCSNQSLASSQTEDEPSVAARIRPQGANPRLTVPPSLPVSDSFGLEALSKVKGKASAHLDSSKHSASFSTVDGQKQQGFSSGALASPWAGALAPSASCQQFGRLSQMPPEQPWIPHCSAQPNQSSIGLPNNMAWQPHLGLFVQVPSHPPTGSQFNFSQNPATMTRGQNLEPPFDWPASSCNPPFGMAQSELHNQRSTACSNNAPQITTQHYTNSGSSIPSLTFQSSSSQSRSSPFGSSSNDSPPPTFETPGPQQQERVPRQDLPLIMEHEPQAFIPERDRIDEGAEEERKRQEDTKDYWDLIDFDAGGKEEEK